MIEEMAFNIYAPTTYYPIYEPSFEEPYVSSGVYAPPAMSPSLSICSSMSTGKKQKKCHVCFEKPNICLPLKNPLNQFNLNLNNTCFLSEWEIEFIISKVEYL